MFNEMEEKISKVSARYIESILTTFTVWEVPNTELLYSYYDNDTFDISYSEILALFVTKLLPGNAVESIYKSSLNWLNVQFDFHFVTLCHCTTFQF